MFTKRQKHAARKVVISFRVTHDEAHSIQKAAAAQSLAETEYVRQRALRIRNRKEPPTNTPEQVQMQRLFLFIAQSLDRLSCESTAMEVQAEIHTILRVLTEFAAGRVHFRTQPGKQARPTESSPNAA